MEDRQASVEEEREIEVIELNLPTRQRQVLEAADELARKGEPVSITVIARSIGIQPTNAHHVVDTLKSKGLWKHPSLKPRPDEREARAAREIRAILARLPDDRTRKAAMKRVNEGMKN